MSSDLQNLLVALMEIQPNASFLDLIIFNSSGACASLTAQDSALGSYLTKIFLLSDICLYFGLVIVILILGFNYRRLGTLELTAKLRHASLFFIYSSLIGNLFGLSHGFTYLTGFTLSIFENSYSFTLLTQLSKLFLLVIAGALYMLFPVVYRSRMRKIELPLLIQIALALCATLISSTNFALLLLALEGFSLTLYIMTALGRTYGGVTAAAKYFAFGTLGSVFLF